MYTYEILEHKTSCKFKLQSHTYEITANFFPLVSGQSHFYIPTLQLFELELSGFLGSASELTWVINLRNTPLQSTPLKPYLYLTSRDSIPSTASVLLT